MLCVSTQHCRSEMQVYGPAKKKYSSHATDDHSCVHLSIRKAQRTQLENPSLQIKYLRIHLRTHLIVPVVTKKRWTTDSRQMNHGAHETHRPLASKASLCRLLSAVRPRTKSGKEVRRSCRYSSSTARAPNSEKEKVAAWRSTCRNEARTVSREAQDTNDGRIGAQSRAARHLRTTCV